MKRLSKQKGILAIVTAPVSLAVKPVVLWFGISLAVLSFTMFNAQHDSLRYVFYDLLAAPLAQISKPVQGLASLVRDISGIAHLQETNAQLLQENQRLKQWYDTALSLQAENKMLRDLLNLELADDFTFATARILTDAGSAFYKSILVAAGTDQGIDKNHVVIADRGVIGRVIESSGNMSRVLLLTDMNSRVPVMIEGSDKHAILRGTNSQSPQLTHISSDEAIAQGRRIVTSGRGGIFPAGLPVGTLFEDDNKLYRVQLFNTVDNLQFVKILKGKTSPSLIE